jgi:hypothetical protein
MPKRSATNNVKKHCHCDDCMSCAHPWFLDFARDGRRYRGMLEKLCGRPVYGFEDAKSEAAKIIASIPIPKSRLRHSTHLIAKRETKARVATRQLGIRLPVQICAQLEAIASGECNSVSTIVRRLVTQVLMQDASR